jgi:hypothetical protein
VTFAVSYATFQYNGVKYTRNCDSLCTAVAGLDDGLIVTDYTMYNSVERCLPSGTVPVALYSHGTLFDATGVSLEEMLIQQARMGGIPTASLAMDSYRRSLPVRGPGLAILKERLDTLAGPRKNLYYITAFNPPLFELIVLNDCPGIHPTDLLVPHGAIRAEEVASDVIS